MLNNKSIRCQEQTRQRILKIAEELNYQPNLSARALKTRIYNAIGCLVYDITDAFVVECIGAIESHLAATNYRALWLSAALHASEKQEDLLAKVRSLSIDGLIVLESESLIADTQLLKLHGRDQMRISTLIRKIEGGHISSVTVDSTAGVRLLVGHLVELGHRELGFCYGPENHPGAIFRFEQFKRLIQEKNLPANSEWFWPADGTVEGGYHAAKQILNCAQKPTAIIAHNDLAAFGCIRACVERGFTVPRQISVAGFDDIRMAGHYNPNLTTVRSDYPALAKAAISQMVSMIEGNWGLFQAEHIVIKPQLVVRESTAIPVAVDRSPEGIMASAI